MVMAFINDAWWCRNCGDDGDYGCAGGDADGDDDSSVGDDEKVSVMMMNDPWTVAVANDA